MNMPNKWASDGLPELLNAACHRWQADDGKTYEYNSLFHSYREVDEHREMTAADLGLPIQYDGKWTDFTLAQNFLWWDHIRVRSVLDAPYSFWLGAAERDERFYQKRLFNDGLLPLRTPA